VTAEAIRERLASLRRAGAELRRRPAAQNLDALARLLDTWSDPSSSWRAALVRELPKATGFSPQTVREGLELALADWNGDALRRLVESELDPGAAPAGFEVTAVLLAGSIPMPTLLALIAPLAVGSPVLAKTAARDPVTAPLLARSLVEIDPLLGACLEVLDLASSDSEGMGALLAADCVAATGSDETLARVSARIGPAQRLVASGHRASLAALGEAASRGELLDRACAGLALDVALWDQLGCLSPIAVYVSGAGAAERVTAALAEALERAQARWPRGAVGDDAAAQLSQERSGAELRAAAGAHVEIRSGSGGTWTIVRESDARLRPAPLHRFVRVHPVEDANALLEAIAPLARHLAGAAVAGFGKQQPALVRALHEAGASRICQPGELQAPPLDWRREGRGVLTPLLRVRTGPLPTE
jgi:hypothetical protein